LYDHLTYAPVDSSKGILQSNGSLSCIFSNAPAGNDFFVTVKHRNSIETWSAAAVTLNSGGSYDYSAGGGYGTGSMIALGYLNPLSKIGSLSANISLLESFGKVKVLSSPKLSVMNNQTAMLRVVDNLVYFTIKADTTTTQGAISTVYTTTANTVPVGFTMSVTPQINDGDTVLLNLRPSISHLLGYVNDPNPSLALATPPIVSRIPQTQTREMESVLKIENNQTAVMGGLMQDSINNLSDEVPILGRIPLLGSLFQQRNDKTEKTELVIFLRPVVIKNASVNADFSEFRNSLPDQKFFQESASEKP
jgi:general secretion pathway protein D